MCYYAAKSYERINSKTGTILSCGAYVMENSETERARIVPSFFAGGWGVWGGGGWHPGGFYQRARGRSIQ